MPVNKQNLYLKKKSTNTATNIKINNPKSWNCIYCLEIGKRKRSKGDSSLVISVTKFHPQSSKISFICLTVLLIFHPYMLLHSRNFYLNIRKSLQTLHDLYLFPNRILYELMFVSSAKFIYWNLTPRVWCPGRWLGCKGGALMSGISAFTKGTPDGFLILFLPHETVRDRKSVV